MAEADWLSATGGSWTVPSNWLVDGSNVVPIRHDDAVIATTGNYRVSVTAAIGVFAIALSDTGATIAIVSVPGTVAVAQDVTLGGVHGRQEPGQFPAAWLARTAAAAGCARHPLRTRPARQRVFDLLPTFP